jgi:3-hydroxyacyl-[acyl-carrier-protein] dehydratase
MPADRDVLALIPHRPPFLWVDRIVSWDQDSIVTEKSIPEDLDVFTGHYPGHPILPGVLLCEAVFQSGALLMTKMQQSGSLALETAVPVLTRIGSARFKRSVFPGDSITMEVRLTEVIASACFFKGKLRVNGKLALDVDFSCTLQSAPAS